MGCSGCGSGSILPGSLSARKRSIDRQSRPRVRGYSSGGIVKSQRRLLRESGQYDVMQAMREAAKVLRADVNRDVQDAITLMSDKSK